MSNVVRCNLDGTASKDLGADYPDLWVTTRVAVDPASLASWIAGPGSQGLVAALDSGLVTVQWAQVWFAGAAWFDPSTAAHAGVAAAATWQTIELHGDASVAELYVNGTLMFTHVPDGPIRNLALGWGYTGQDPALFYVGAVKAGTTRGGDDVFSDDFSTGDFSRWDSSSGDITVVDDPYPPPTTLLIQTFFAAGLNPQDSDFELGNISGGGASEWPVGLRRATFDPLTLDDVQKTQLLSVRITQTAPSARTEIYSLDIAMRPLPSSLEGDDQ